MIFHSPRQALAYLFAAQRGPGMARPSYGRVPRDTGRHHFDHVELGAYLYGPRNKGMCGVVMGSHLDTALREWATERGTHRSDQVRAIERRLRCLLRAHGVMPVRRRFQCVRVPTGQVDETGQERTSVLALGFEDVSEKPLASVAKFCSHLGSLG